MSTLHSVDDGAWRLLTQAMTRTLLDPAMPRPGAVAVLVPPPLAVLTAATGWVPVSRGWFGAQPPGLST